ncbi:MAG: adenosylcobalamin-dependent ribonucleoside-diphosphate reductase [Planctomycetes bacterium]|nr:adenosylcobalamin-dependent ribonucleoside-diphosphate reductase [Planctomycetota bacterium]
MPAPLTPNAQRVLERRYLLRDAKGELAEDPAGLFRRVARAVAAAERRLGPERDAARRAAHWAERFERSMTSLEFLPNSPCLMNAGTPLGQLAACFVLPVGDSLPGIFDAVRDMALIHQSGGGVGFDFTPLRPRGDLVKSTHGVASGPVSFMGVFDAATEAIKQGGRRRGANMGVLDARHPDVLEFVEAKRDPRVLRNFNVSVAMPDAVLRAAAAGRSYALLDPRSGRTAGRGDAAELLERIARAAWESGDPGLLFPDAIARRNPVPALGRIAATNPCGEQPLLPHETCTLGSIAVQRFVRGGSFDRERLAEAVAVGVRFLDDVLEATRHPLEEVRRATRRTRKIGLGVMGFADALLALGIPYDAPEALAAAEDLMRFVTREARRASEALARERGPYPAFRRSRDAAAGRPPLRNATRTTVAPTGTVALVAGCSSGIEPIFALLHRRRAFGGEEILDEVHPALIPALERAGLAAGEWIPRIAQAGSLRALGDPVPADLRRLFVTALEIPPDHHVRVQAAFQRRTDSAVSKTVNLPRAATPADVAAVYRLAWESGCKGITVYRYGSREGQVLCLPEDAEPGSARECAG